MEYLTKLKENNSLPLFNILDTVQWRITPDKNIEFTFDSSAMFLEFENSKEDFIQNVRQHLNNYAIRIFSKVTQNQNTLNHIKTRREIFQELVDQNPAVELLRKKFNLDIDSDPG